ncbi:acyltransferase [Massilia sp. CF038]|uniref:acyltransferase family protein n=1 Tax=Massilia sp. CF038 TaxID=1881045 RepID=UPI000921BFEF|nr:acyltransferase [Massilia sp. CF038]SHH42059.1 Acyltransferase family protein [Massilia sp. CF038]
MNQNFLKGLLIILVIADHNEFTRSLFPEFFRGLTFHVVGFMTIPFLRPPMQVASSAFANYVFRLYYPFLLLCCTLWLVVTVSGSTPLATRLGLLGAVLYSGNADLLKQVVHMGLLWFLPSFIALVTIRNLIDTQGGRVRQTALVLLLAAHLVIGIVAKATQDYLPLGLLPALYMIPLAYAGVAAQQRWFAPMGTAPAIALSSLLFVVVKALQMHLRLENEVGFAFVADVRTPLALVINDLEAVCGTLMLFQIARLPLDGVIAACGKVSMQIYLFHAFVALAIYKLLMLVSPQGSPVWQFPLSMAATVLLTLALARLVMQTAPLRRWLFPRSLDDLRGKASDVPASPQSP